MTTIDIRKASTLGKIDSMAATVDLDQDRRNEQPRILTEAERERLDEYIDQIHYSGRCVVLRH